MKNLKEDASSIQVDALLPETTPYDNCLDQMDFKINLDDFIESPESPDTEPEWKKHWVNMPEFIQEKKESYKKLIVHFDSEEDYQLFANLINQNLTHKTKSIHFPKQEPEDNKLLRWVEMI